VPSLKGEVAKASLPRRGAKGPARQSRKTEQEEQTEKWDSCLSFCHLFFCQQVFHSKSMTRTAPSMIRGTLSLFASLFSRLVPLRLLRRVPPANLQSQGTDAGFCPGCRTSRCLLRPNSGTGCGNGCVRDWLFAHDPAGLLRISTPPARQSIGRPGRRLRGRRPASQRHINATSKPPQSHLVGKR